MKKSNYAIEFSTIFLLFVAPPIFLSVKTSAPHKAIYPASVFIHALCMAFILFVHRKTLSAPQAATGTGPAPEKTNRLLKNSSALITFGTLWLTASILQLAVYAAGKAGLSLPLTPPEKLLLPPAGLLEWANCISGTIAAAFFEEALFRCYLPSMLAFLTDGKEKYRKPIEISCLLLFALAHRYLGLPGFLNALISGAALRWCTLKTGSILRPACVHTAYNALVLAFTFLQ